MSLPFLYLGFLALRHFVNGVPAAQCTRNFISLLVIMYNGLVTKAFEIFICQDLPDGSQVPPK